MRCDRGTENYHIAYFMLNHPLRGPGRGSIITGSSVHNQRIERFWRDLFRGCICIFYHLFYYLEDNGLLDCTNDVHLYCLHSVYQQYINYSISVFISGWSNHRIRSARNSSPMQLWISGMVNNYASGYNLTNEIYGSGDTYYVGHKAKYNELHCIL